MIEGEERNNSFCHMCQRVHGRRKHRGEKSVARQSESLRGKKAKRSCGFVGVADTCGELVQWRRLQQKSLNTLSYRMGKDSIKAKERKVGKIAVACFAKRKRNKAIHPNHKIVRWERVKVGKSRTLSNKGGSEREHAIERVDFAKLREGEERQAKKGLR